MSKLSPSFSEIDAERPEIKDLEASYEALWSQLDAAEEANDLQAAHAVVDAWDRLRKTMSTWFALTRLRYRQDSSNETYKAEQDYADELDPLLTDLRVKTMRRLLESPLREGLEAQIGTHAFDLWTCEITTFLPAIQKAMERENNLRAEYTKLRASAEIEFDSETYNLSGISKFMDVADRDVRERAQRARWSWVEEHADEFDRIFDDLVSVRDGMAKSLDYKDFVDLGYRRMSRIDYDRDDVETFRAQVQDKIVPLIADIRERQRAKLDLDTLMVWDEAVHDLRGNPVPQGDVDELTRKARSMFDTMHPDLGEFFAMMDDRDLLDLDTRKNKVGGGFCTWFADYGVPYIFANFNGSKHDAEVFTHEMGHAFQCYKSRLKTPIDYVWPTYESAEIHSMSLEFLTWPYIDRLFGDDADRFKTIHLTESLAFIPYGTAVDHFQHLIYENPEATPEERRKMWTQMEETYLPWRNWGDITHGAEGGRWHLQGHLYSMPFYYIDYVLAMTCALQFWDRMNQDYDRALTDYVTLCEKGGEAPFQELASSAGLKSPFEPGCLEAVVDRARETLKL